MSVTDAPATPDATPDGVGPVDLPHLDVFPSEAHWVARINATSDGVGPTDVPYLSTFPAQAHWVVRIMKQLPNFAFANCWRRHILVVSELAGLVSWRAAIEKQTSPARDLTDWMNALPSSAERISAALAGCRERCALPADSVHFAQHYTEGMDSTPTVGDSYPEHQLRMDTSTVARRIVLDRKQQAVDPLQRT